MRIALWLICLPFGAAAEPLLRSEGVATTLDGRLAYREVHWQRGVADGAQRWVHYLCPDGRPFARKQMPATQFALARGYHLEDGRSGQQGSVEVTGDSVQIDWKEDAATMARRQRLDLPPDAVIDAGFDAAIRSHWQALMQYRTVDLQFLVPGRRSFYPVRVKRSGQVQWQGQAAQSIDVRLDTWYGAVAPRLSLVYADADRRLLEFRGTSNLRDPRGQYPVVVVSFAEAAVERPDRLWQQELLQPLVSRCETAG